MAYRGLSLLFSTLGGMLAGMLFKQVWKRAAGRDDAPDPDDQNATWKQVLVTAAAQGAVSGLVRATVKRAGAQSVRKTTGRWPGDD